MQMLGQRPSGALDLGSQSMIYLASPILVGRWGDLGIAAHVSVPMPIVAPQRSPQTSKHPGALLGSYVSRHTAHPGPHLRVSSLLTELHFTVYSTFQRQHLPDPI